ncbi:MAG: haloacid dehalogenase [Chloroflexi bacterium]|nr:haloacid dehalogenase [Chloroflexota bacterium]
MSRLQDIVERIRADFEARNAARDQALIRSRELTRHCANAIRATHRGDFAAAQALLNTAAKEAAVMAADLEDYPDLYYAGYTQDALKEYVEASVTYAVIHGEPLPSPEELRVEYPAYLNGLAEASSELRRHTLDLIRHGEASQGERILEVMEDIYAELITIDYPDAITGGLRRTTDQLRAVLERTRGDLTLSIRQEAMRQALQDFESRMMPGGGPDE